MQHSNCYSDVKIILQYHKFEHGGYLMVKLGLVYKEPFSFYFFWNFQSPVPYFDPPSRLLEPPVAVFSGANSTTIIIILSMSAEIGNVSIGLIFLHILDRKLFSFSIATTKNHQRDHKMFLQELTEKILPIKNKIKA